MEFKIKQSSTFAMNICLIILALGMAVFCFFVKNELFHYTYILWLFIAALRLAVYKNYFLLIFRNRPVLEANEIYIFDLANNIKYYWEDIDEIYEDNAYLYLKLYNPNKYLEKIRNPLKRFIIGVSGALFKINIDMVNINHLALIEILDNYSIQAAGTEKSGYKSETT